MKQGQNQLFAAIAFGAIFSFSLGAGLPSHITGSVSPTALQWNNVIDHEIFAPSCRFPSYRAGMIFTELMLCVIGPKDSPARVPNTRLTLPSERRNDQQ